MKKTQIFKIDGDRITRQRRSCPKCGDGVFLAEHKDRNSCGKCGYTEFKSGGKKPQKMETPAPVQPVSEKPSDSESIGEKPVGAPSESSGEESLSAESAEEKA